MSKVKGLRSTNWQSQNSQKMTHEIMGYSNSFVNLAGFVKKTAEFDLNLGEV